jgi:hypothetical protein
MTRIFALAMLLLLVSCGGGFNGARPGPGGKQSAGELALRLSASESGGTVKVVLSAPAAADLYQLAGTLLYDADKYSILAVEAGGGLGNPEESYFFSSEQTPGKLGFAYTKRMWGAGANGACQLLVLRAEAKGAFSPADFKLDTRAGQLRARNSAKVEFSANCGAAEVR